MHLADDIGSSDAEVLIAALEAGATKVIGAEIEVLDEGAESSVKNNDAFVTAERYGWRDIGDNATVRALRPEGTWFNVSTQNRCDRCCASIS